MVTFFLPSTHREVVLLFQMGFFLPDLFFFFTTSKYVCGCVTFAYALRQHQCFFALNRINLFPVLYILFNKSFQKVFTLDSLSNIKGWCECEYVFG